MATKTLKNNLGHARRSTPAKRARVLGTVPGSSRKLDRKTHGKHLISQSLSGTASRQKAPRRPAIPVDERHVAAVQSFEAGLQLEQRQNYRKARDVFEKLVAAGPADVADRARVHLRACSERMGTRGPAPRTAGDYHVLGVAELNVGALDRAVEHLSKARKLEPKREEIRYALAAAHALRGDRDAALEHLEAAISLRPQNRFQARHDADFQPLSADPRFLSLVNAHADGGYGPTP
jgi:tetratricopeptide (TPR) repeat protein